MEIDAIPDVNFGQRDVQVPSLVGSTWLQLLTGNRIGPDLRGTYSVREHMQRKYRLQPAVVRVLCRRWQASNGVRRARIKMCAIPRKESRTPANFAFDFVADWRALMPAHCLPELSSGWKFAWNCHEERRDLRIDEGTGHEGGL